MKRKFIIACILIFLSGAAFTQSTPYNVVFDITTADTDRHRAVIVWIDFILSNHPDAKLEVVYYGHALGMVTKGKSTVANDVERLIANNKNVHFKVCEFAMKHHNLTKDQLLTGVETVPDGIYEIITKEAEGFGYIKATL